MNKRNIMLTILLIYTISLLTGCSAKKLDPFDPKIFNVKSNGVVIDYNIIDGYIKPEIKNNISEDDVRSELKYTIPSKEKMLFGDSFVVNVDMPSDMKEKYELKETSITVDVPKVPNSNVPVSELNDELINDIKKKIVQDLGHVFEETKFHTHVFQETYLGYEPIWGRNNVTEEDIVNLKSVCNPEFSVDTNENNEWKYIGETQIYSEGQYYLEDKLLFIYNELECNYNFNEFDVFRMNDKVWRWEGSLSDLIDYQNPYIVQTNNSVLEFNVLFPFKEDSQIYKVLNEYYESKNWKYYYYVDSSYNTTRGALYDIPKLYDSNNYYYLNQVHFMYDDNSQIYSYYTSIDDYFITHNYEYDSECFNWRIIQHNVYQINE